MTMKREIEYRALAEDDECDDVFLSDEGENDFTDCYQCASDPCLSDWLSAAF